MDIENVKKDRPRILQALEKHCLCIGDIQEIIKDRFRKHYHTDLIDAGIAALVADGYVRLAAPDGQSPRCYELTKRGGKIVAQIRCLAREGHPRAIELLGPTFSPNM